MKKNVYMHAGSLYLARAGPARPALAGARPPLHLPLARYKCPACTHAYINLHHPILFYITIYYAILQ